MWLELRAICCHPTPSRRTWPWIMDPPTTNEDGTEGREKRGDTRRRLTRWSPSRPSVASIDRTTASDGDIGRLCSRVWRTLLDGTISAGRDKLADWQFPHWRHFLNDLKITQFRVTKKSLSSTLSLRWDYFSASLGLLFAPASHTMECFPEDRVITQIGWEIHWIRLREPIEMSHNLVPWIALLRVIPRMYAITDCHCYYDWMSEEQRGSRLGCIIQERACWKCWPIESFPRNASYS